MDGLANPTVGRIHPTVVIAAGRRGVGEAIATKTKAARRRLWSNTRRPSDGGGFGLLAAPARAARTPLAAQVDQATFGSLKASISPLNASTGTQLQNTFLSP